MMNGRFWEGVAVGALTLCLVVFILWELAP